MRFLKILQATRDAPRAEDAEYWEDDGPPGCQCCQAGAGFVQDALIIVGVSGAELLDSAGESLERCAGLAEVQVFRPAEHDCTSAGKGQLVHGLDLRVVAVPVLLDLRKQWRVLGCVLAGYKLLE